MAKLSLSWALNRKKRIRMVTGVAIFLLLFFGISMMISNNPRGTRAASYGGGNYLINGQSICRANIVGSNWACTTGFTTTTISATEDVIFDGGGVANKYQFVTRGNPHFKNLTIQNYAVVTHEALVQLYNDFNVASPYDLTSNGQAKKVDLLIDEDLTLISGGSINVNGKGYPGGVAAGGNGYGLGASIGLVSSTNPTTGAGYGGNGGGASVTNGGLSYPTSYNSDVFQDSQFYHGSGSGGSSISFATPVSVVGAKGGGRVHLKIGNGLYIKDAVSNILANGEDGTRAFDGGICGAGSGGASGGTIWIESSLISTTGTSYSVAGGASSVPGAVGFASIDASFILHNINATGGLGAEGCNGSLRYGGGGGRLVAKRIIDQPITIKKTLEPIARGSITFFNPYALQKGDIIQINLEVSNLIPGNLHIEDEVLKVPYNDNVYCKYQENSLINLDTMNIFSPDNIKLPDIVSWDYTIGSEVTRKFRYECVVQ